MKYYDLTVLVLKIMKEKPLRFSLTGFGIFIGIFTFVFFQLASSGLSAGVENQISSFGLNVLTITPANAQQQNGPPQGDGITDSLVNDVKRVACGYDYVSPTIFYQGIFEYGREENVIVTLGYPDEDLDAIYEDLNFEVEEGRNIRAGDSGVVVLGAKVATQTFDRELRVGNSISFNDKSFRVVGIGEPRDDVFVDFSMRMPFDDIKEISEQETYTNVRVSYPQEVDLEFEKEKIENYFNRQNQPRVISISSPQQTLEQINQIFFTLNIVIGFISGIALIVGGINVMNTMYSNVLERINEISVFKAMGATNEQIIYMYLVESIILSVIGSIIGFLSSYYIAKILSSYVQENVGFAFPVEFNVVFFVGVLIVTVIFGSFFGAYPAYLAAKVNPADNLRDE